jgi:heavy metal sensor kinase
VRLIHPLRRYPVRLRLALWNVGVLALVLAAFAGAIRYTDEVTWTAKLERELDRHATFVLEGVPGPPGMPPPFDDRLPPGGERMPPDFARRGPADGRAGEHGPEGWGRGPGGPHHGPGPGPHGGPGEGPPGPPIRFLADRLLDPSGRLLDSSDRSQTGTRPGPWDRAGFAQALRAQHKVYSNITVAGEPVRVLSVPLRQDGQTAGVLQVAAPLTVMYEELARLSGVLMMLFPLALLVAALGGIFLTEGALRPVRQITQAAAQIGASDLGARLSVEGKDEFSELAGTFNGMLGRLEQAFTQLAQALNQKAEALDQQRRFTADASHELRTPLTIIKANTSLALEEERSNVEYRRALEAADRAADTTTRIVQDLLLLARGDVGQLRLEPCPIRIDELLEHAVGPFRRAAGPAITIEPPGLSLIVTGDPHHLLRLFTNLLENAVRHTPRAGQITISGEVAEGHAVVRVWDTGEGIPPEHLPHVCERFYRVDAARARYRGGTGLGLAICQTIVEAHHGSLTIESVVNRGTTVTVRLPGPIIRAEDAPGVSVDEAAARDCGASFHHSSTIGSSA